MTLTYLLLSILTCWDVLSTLYVLKHGGHETWPIFAKLFARYPQYTVQILVGGKLIAAGAIWYAATRGEFPPQLQWACVALYAVVAVNNLLAVIKSKRSGA